MITQKIKEIKTTDRVDRSAVSLEIKGVRLKFAPLKDPDTEKALLQLADNERAIRNLERLSVFFTTVMVITAVAAVGTAIYSWDKEHGREIGMGSIITAVVALSWQYIGAGISAGVAVFVFIMLVASFT